MPRLIQLDEDEKQTLTPGQSSDSTDSSFAERLSAALNGMSVYAFAQKSGIPDSTIRKYLAGSMPGLEKLLVISETANVTLDWLAGARGPMRPARTSLADNMVQLPRYEVRAAAGSGALALTEAVSSYFSVEREWLRRSLPAWAGNNAEVGILEGSGDSMEPTIRDGDLVMAVRNPPEYAVERGGVFLLLHHGHLRIKRLHVDMRSGDISLISDNQRYPIEVVKKDRLEYDLQILALIFFAGGRLRS